MPAGRFAPSPSGDLHLGNLRTALLAWLFARSTGRQFLMRVEDLDRVREGAEARQLADLRAIGLDWDGPVVRQSERTALYDDAIAHLTAAGMTYECFCTRREIQEAASAPHAPDGAYPGTCRNLTAAERATKTRPPAVRLKADVTEFSVHDDVLGAFHGQVDDLVLRRVDGVAAYNLAVVVDDGEQGVDQVVRGDDLLTSSPRQAYLASLLDIPAPTYAHVPLALNAQGKRLAKRDGAVTLEDQAALGLGPRDVLHLLARSLELAEADEQVSPGDILRRFDPQKLPTTPWVFET
ncbi:tRNA glutamyl-Q(34) synthetase GluQRS [Rhodococcus sp. 06-156-3C]|uniref:tRNA glutamyl-Q(34) synthetase GluQRS n=1 Tax=Nocardiaceae TaxID=85025 RepID=UPI000522ECC7|nr:MULTISPECIES: tRNA glutamyl-Q(34) synthetase GluQRS [Rhodococcus]OZD14814.1 tRNA glutamyl-Q(34) synthetase GluQRS [Rhodococcus sp. 06-156-4C]OZD20106.1 tRNA glutamyl-Q(34) synthetase GluQRS [Rhodococcus sp. 06-156-4a]OZD22587.1 tRNA glutamyl-Q(34) synthetase GluQRS [Rhodococcus sp. 06-156-3C]OZD26123.1 tRNA glutamyl-Q(34) synthetase GluQRS [Rhodococcus sp. 06-156-3b]OZD38330.1 tRNA glutamyl-Q(34) synthetase GluQRS [Rhodococcus sp. 06-156-3]